MDNINTNCDFISFKLESIDLNKYLERSSIIDYDSEIIDNKLSELTRDVKSKLEKVRVIFEYVRLSIPHSLDTNSELLPCSASEVIKDNVGICYSKSHLFAAMLRKINIPTGFCYLKMVSNKPYTGFVLHGFNAFYLSELDSWIIVDAGGESTNQGEFNLEKMKLAYTVDNSIGEEIYNQIFDKPDKRVVDFLIKYESKTQAWQDIPSNLYSYNK